MSLWDLWEAVGHRLWGHQQGPEEGQQARHWPGSTEGGEGWVWPGPVPIAGLHVESPAAQVSFQVFLGLGN